jgi:hypothetical protein
MSLCFVQARQLQAAAPASEVGNACMFYVAIGAIDNVFGELLHVSSGN